jgi:DNA gyrase inhibitor GyrI
LHFDTWQEEAEDVVADCFEKLLKMSNENGSKNSSLTRLTLNFADSHRENKCLDVLKARKPK